MLILTSIYIYIYISFYLYLQLMILGYVDWQKHGTKHLECCAQGFKEDVSDALKATFATLALWCRAHFGGLQRVK